MTNWETIRSREEAEAEARRGRLVAIQLLPSELGGAASADNIVFVPPQARVEKDATSTELLALFRAGKADQLSVTPDYRGGSIVPSALQVRAWREGEAPSFERLIKIW